MKYFIFAFIFITIAAAAQQDEVPRLQWAGPVGSHPGTYEEWIRQNPVQPFSAVLDRIVIGNGRRGTVAILTQSSIAGSLTPGLNQLLANLQSEGYSVLSYQITGGTPETLRTFLNSLYTSNGIEGALFVGNLPVCWFEIQNDYNTYGYAQFPCDLFFMDLNGTWLDTMSTGNGKYDGHTGAVVPEIYVTRLTTGGSVSDTALLKNYFLKDNSFRHDTLFLDPQALVFVDDDWISWGPQWAQDVARLYADTMNYWDAETTRASVYRIKLNTPRAWVSVFAHSSSSLHQFTYNSGSAHDYYYASEYITQNPPANFYNHFACSFARYTDNNYGSGRSVFNPSYGLAAVGSTKTGSMLDFQYFYQPLSEGKTLGEAFKDWFTYIVANGVTFNELCWHYGMTVIADAWLLPTGHQHVVAENGGRWTPSSKVTVLENPVRDYLRFEVTVGALSRINAAWYDIQGRKTGEMILPRTAAGKIRVNVPVVNLSAGVYLLRVEIDGKAHEVKIIKLN